MNEPLLALTGDVLKLKNCLYTAGVETHYNQECSKTDERYRHILMSLSSSLTKLSNTNRYPSYKKF